MWLFDCGESTQLQLQKSVISASKINKIFITHTHGDHLFGLGGTLCMLGQASLTERGKAKLTGQSFEPIEIYGPEGLRRYLRTVISLTYSKVVVPHIIHELKNIPYLHGRFAKKPYYPEEPPSLPNPTYGEMKQGRDIYPDANGIYHLVNDSEIGITVQAAPLEHSIPCVGFVVHEKDKVGRLREEVALKHVIQNKVTTASSLY
jgi:ribonuclease Z